jgi:hypothetical protein
MDIKKAGHSAPPFFVYSSTLVYSSSIGY